MDFIDISDTVSVNVNYIQAVVDTSKSKEFKSKVYVSDKYYPSNLTKSEILRKCNSKGVRNFGTVRDQIANINKQKQEFAG